MSITNEIVQELREVAYELRYLKSGMLFQEDEDDLIELVQRLEMLIDDLGND